jgi:serine/threonine-protein kinase SRK2
MASLEDYDFVREISSGSFGMTRLYRNKITMELEVIKFLERGQGISPYCQNEILNHQKLNDPHIIKFKKTFLTEDSLCIVMEYAHKGDFFEFICNKGCLNETWARFCFQQIALAVNLCHENHICHGDIKPENILVSGDDNVPVLKLCDFGLSYTSRMNKKKPSGTIFFIAPEIIENSSYDGVKADIWACGVTLYVMLFGTYPFQDQRDPLNHKKIVKRIVKGKYTYPALIHISESCRDLLDKIFVVNPKKRIGMYDIMNHPWFKQEFYHNMASIGNTIDKVDKLNNFGCHQTADEIKQIIKEACINPNDKDVYIDNDTNNYDDIDGDFIKFCCVKS